MPRASAHSRRSRRGILLGLSFALMAGLYAAGAAAQQRPPPEDRPPINTPLLLIEAVTAPVAGPPDGTVIMTLTVDCGTVENARLIDTMIPRVYNATIIELNREPLGSGGRISDQDLEGLKRRLLFQINRALKGPQVVGVYIRSLQEVPRRGR